jgi:hypothetical protein
MKKLQNLTEPQKIIALVAPLPLVALVASVALLNYYIDFTSAVFIVVALLFIGAISSGVSVAVVKDEHLARVVRGYRSLNTENRDSARIIGELRDTNRALVASLANARERIARDGSDLIEHDLADKYADKLHTFTNAVYHFGWALIEDGDLFESAKFALLAIHGENLTETASAQVFRDYVLDIYADDDAPTTPTPTDYTHSASTALLIGTLDRAYEVNGETRYPLA